MNNKHIKLVPADKIINHFNPIIGNNHPPEIAETVAAKLETEHNMANELDSNPSIQLFAINVIISKCMNIPIKPKIMPYIISVIGVKYK